MHSRQRDLGIVLDITIINLNTGVWRRRGTPVLMNNGGRKGRNQEQAGGLPLNLGSDFEGDFEAFPVVSGEHFHGFLVIFDVAGDGVDVEGPAEAVADVGEVHQG